jgi:DNA-binding FadR family transcriptional regulator
MQTPVRGERLYEDIVRQIEDRVMSGDLRPGDRLPTERELAQQFGVSRTAVRDAARSLAQKGLLEMRPGRGTFIVDQMTQSMRETLDLVMRHRPASGVQELLEVRELLEPEIAALAAQRVSGEGLEALRSLVLRMEQSLDDVDAFVAANDVFHRMLTHSTGNSFIIRVIEPIIDMLRRQRATSGFVADSPRRAQVHHRRIMAALLDRNPAEVREAMRAHLVQIREDYEAALSHQRRDAYGERQSTVAAVLAGEQAD